MKSHPIFPSLRQVFAVFKVLHNTTSVQKLDIWHKVGGGRRCTISYRSCNQIFLSLWKKTPRVNMVSRHELNHGFSCKHQTGQTGLAFLGFCCQFFGAVVLKTSKTQTQTMLGLNWVPSAYWRLRKKWGTRGEREEMEPAPSSKSQNWGKMKGSSPFLLSAT